MKWIRSFLCGRAPCVNVEAAMSKWKKVIRRISQGYVLGPISFVVFINDMPDEVKYSICKLFADNCKLYGIVKSTNENNLQQDLKNLQ